MEIVLNLTNEEIEEALLTHISNAGIDMEGKTTVIAVTSGRKGNGLRAEITINSIATEPVEDTPSTNNSVTDEPDEDVKENGSVTNSLFETNG